MENENVRYTALQIARYIITKCTRDSKPISNLQLQKILYYVQKAFLVRGREAFADEIEAWQFGPVVPEVYHRYCGFGSLPIRMEYDEEIIPEYSCIIDPIVVAKRVLKPWDLVEDTHKEGKAWYEIYQGGVGSFCIIPKELIRTKG